MTVRISVQQKYKGEATGFLMEVPEAPWTQDTLGAHLETRVRRYLSSKYTITATLPTGECWRIW